MKGYVPACRDEAFAGAREQFAGTEEWLAGEAAGLQHAELEEQLEERGRELMRRLFQGHLDLLAAHEERRGDVAGEDGSVRTRAERGRTRPLVTRFGQVAVSRIAYRPPGLPNVHLLDATLNLPGEKHSRGLRKLAAVEAARGSMEAAGAAITRATGVTIGKRQVEELARRCAAHVEAFYLHRVAGPAPDGCPLILTFDGKAQAAAPEKKQKPREPQARGKWLTASVTDDIPAVIAAAFGEAERRDPGHQREWAVLIDGNNTQIEAVTTGAASRGVTVTVVIDFIHVLEYLWKAAWSFSGKGEPAAEDWVAGQARKILRGRSAQVAAGIRRHATTYGYTGGVKRGAPAARSARTNDVEARKVPA